MALAGIHAYPTGFGFLLSLRLRNITAATPQPWPFPSCAGRSLDPLPDDVLRVGVQFADGRSATNLDDLYPGSLEREGDRPVL